MGRPAKFSADQILDAAVALATARGPAGVSVTAIADHLDAPSGSIYHRFASRDLLMAHVWIRAVRRAQEGFLQALADPRPDALVRAATHIPRWSRDHLAEAQILLLYRREDLAERWPAELGDELSTLNDRLAEALREATRRIFGRVSASGLETVTFAFVDVPYAAVRRHLLRGTAPPPSVDERVADVVAHILDTEAHARASLPN